jgi:hypothetical protein
MLASGVSQKAKFSKPGASRWFYELIIIGSRDIVGQIAVPQGAYNQVTPGVLYTGCRMIF